MLAGKRAVRVGDQLLKEMAELLMKKVRDPRVKGTTLTGIHLSNDLRNARVYFSVLGDEQAVRDAQAGLDSAKGYIKREIGFRLALKYIPDIVFKHDRTLEMGDHMEKLFETLKSEETPKAEE
jgi:ribosome-binding factor A